MGVPAEVGETIMSRTAGAMQSYFLGMTIVAAFSAVIVGAGALILGVPLAGTITAVTFLGGYIPYLGAWTAGAFAVLMALGSSGPETAVAMAVIALLANGVLQQMVQPIAYGADPGHPPARGPDRHDRGRRPVRDDRADPRRAIDIGCREDHR